MESSTRRPWSFIAGAVIFTLGLAAALSAFGGGFPVGFALAALVAGAACEIGAGFELRREGGAWIAPIFSGGTMLFLALFMLGLHPLIHQPLNAHELAMMLGVYCLANWLFRATDLWADQPRAKVAEAVNTVFTGVLSVLLIHFWRDAQLWQVALAAGIALMSAGAAVAHAAAKAYRHPELSAYDDLASAVSGIADLRAKVEAGDPRR